MSTNLDKLTYEELEQRNKDLEYEIERLLEIIKESERNNANLAVILDKCSTTIDTLVSQLSENNQL